MMYFLYDEVPLGVVPFPIEGQTPVILLLGLLLISAVGIALAARRRDPWADVRIRPFAPEVGGRWLPHHMGGLLWRDRGGGQGPARAPQRQLPSSFRAGCSNSQNTAR